MTPPPKQPAPLISVCIPVFNGAKYIRACIESVLNQSEENFEILICDNNSTDRTLDICNELADPRMRILKNNRNIGSIENFYRCIQNAIGELFILLPCDDLLEKDCLELMSKGFIENPSVGIAYGSHFQIDQQNIKMRTNVVTQVGVLVREEAIRMVAENFNPMQHPMVRLKALSKIGKFNKAYGCFCDIHLWVQILFCGWDAYVIGKPVTAVRSHKNQGQSLFLQNTKDNLERLSGHYGHPLTPDFYRENHYNLLFFRFIRFFNDNVNTETAQCGKLRHIMRSRLVRSHVRNVLFSLRMRNTASCAMECALSAELIKYYGFIQMLRAYSSVGGYFFKRMLQN